MTSPGLSYAQWRKSTHSNASGNCVEVAAVAVPKPSRRACAGSGAVAVRDLRDPDAQEVRFHADQ